MLGYKRNMQINKSVFSFEDPVDFLNHQLQERQRKNPKFSLRAWSRQVGYKNPSLLSQVLKRERKLKMEMASKLAVSLGLDGKPLRYFEVIVLYKNSNSDTEKRLYKNMMERVRPKKFKSVSLLSLDIFSLASDWYHWAILGMVDLLDFRDDAAYLQSRLDRSLTKKQLKAALDRLVRLKLLIKDADGKLKKANGDNPIFLENNIPSEAVRIYHAQMLEKAKTALSAQDISERHFCSSSISFKIENYPKILEIIQRAHEELMRYGATGDGDELYQFNTQFFRLSNKNEMKKEGLLQ